MYFERRFFCRKVSLESFPRGTPEESKAKAPSGQINVL